MDENTNESKKQMKKWNKTITLSRNQLIFAGFIVAVFSAISVSAFYYAFIINNTNSDLQNLKKPEDNSTKNDATKDINSEKKMSQKIKSNTVDIDGYTFNLPETWTSTKDPDSSVEGVISIKITPESKYYTKDENDYSNNAKIKNVSLGVASPAGKDDFGRDMYHPSSTVSATDSTDVAGKTVQNYVYGDGLPGGYDFVYSFAVFDSSSSKNLFIEYSEMGKEPISNKAELLEFRQQLREIVASGKSLFHRRLKILT